MKLLLLLLALIIQCFGAHCTLTIRQCLTITVENISLAMEGEWMVEFYAPWCPACNSFAKTWEQFAESVDIKVARVNVVEETELSSRFLVTALPTIFHFKDGEIRFYNMQKRDLNTMQKFVNEKQWENISIVPWYSQPYSLAMTVLSYIIRLFMFIESLFKYLSAQFTVDPFVLAGSFVGLSLLGGLTCGGLLYFCCGLHKINNYVPKKVRLAENTTEINAKDTVIKKNE